MTQPSSSRNALPAALVVLALASLPARVTAEESSAEAAPVENDVPLAEPLSFKAGVESSEVSLAEPFAVTVEIRHRAGEKYTLAPGMDLEPFHLRSVQTEQRGRDPQTTTLRLVLQAFETGERKIPALRLDVDTPEGLRRLEIPEQELRVAGVIDPDQSDPKMREDLRPLPTRFRAIWWPLALIAAAVLAVLVVLWWRRRAERPAPLAPPKPRALPFDEAIARLEALDRSSLVAEGQVQLYYFRLSEIVRDYVGRRYGFESLELTTDELLAELRRRSTPGLDFDGLSFFLHDADLVKFARQSASPGECKQTLEAMRRLVERSRPAPEQAGRAAG